MDAAIIDGLPLAAEQLLELIGPGQWPLQLTTRAKTDFLAQAQQLGELALLHRDGVRGKRSG